MSHNNSSSDPSITLHYSQAESANLHDFICYWEGCSQSFDCLEELAVHIDDSHVSKISSRKNVSCYWTQCRRVEPFGDITLLTQHIRSHTGEKPFKCSYRGCDAKFAAKSNLIAHCKRRHGKLIDPIYIDPREQLRAGIRTTKEMLQMEANAAAAAVTTPSSQIATEDYVHHRKMAKKPPTPNPTPNAALHEMKNGEIFNPEHVNELLSTTEAEEALQTVALDINNRNSISTVNEHLQKLTLKITFLDSSLAQVKLLNKEVCYLLAKYASFPDAFPSCVIANLAKFRDDFSLLQSRIESKIGQCRNVQECIKNKIFYCMLERFETKLN